MKNYLYPSLATFAVLTLPISGVAQATTLPSQHMSQGVYLVELSAAKTFSQQASELDKVLNEFCRSGEGIHTLQSQWQQTMHAWMALQGQERGPQGALEQSWNIQFWPDKKNTTGRKMSALVKQDKRDWSAEDISQQSVTVQGLGSMEWLLYDKASNFKTSKNTCALGAAISRNLSNNAATVAEAWEENPWTELPQKNWESEYIALLSNQLDYTMKKLSRPLAKVGKPRPYFAESWRSETSLKNLEHNVVALKRLYLANGQGLDAYLRLIGKPQLADRILAQFNQTLETWPTETSLFALLQTKSGYQSVLNQYNKLERLNYLIHEEVAIELGVVIGFNATDGD
ncbi:imelysin family protein [Vibrio fluminensis]|uniref:imelysin family protein n=1 Tax=Vibrio fluminensis TaxID=2783614 RepID=UPI0018891154|nr:imelysin family protein [Vibrio fluminensis]